MLWSSKTEKKERFVERVRVLPYHNAKCVCVCVCVLGFVYAYVWEIHTRAQRSGRSPRDGTLVCAHRCVYIYIYTVLYMVRGCVPRVHRNSR